MTITSSHQIGLMSDTHLDGIIGVLIRFNAGKPELLRHTRCFCLKELGKKPTDLLTTSYNDTEPMMHIDSRESHQTWSKQRHLPGPHKRLLQISPLTFIKQQEQATTIDLG